MKDIRKGISACLSMYVYVWDMHNIHVRLLMWASDPDVILMDSNDRPHAAQFVDDFHEQADIRHIDWPARSLNLNPNATTSNPSQDLPESAFLDKCVLSLLPKVVHN